jgi:YegS/Rv2252/BmrU family lipid kinase
MKILVVLNPVAGRGRAPRRSARLVRGLEERGHAVELFETRAPGDAGKRARAREGHVDRIVVVGGDGTLNEVVNGLADPASTPLAQLALGTANLLARELRLPRRPELLADLVDEGFLRRIDLGHADGRRFLLLVSAGFDAQVTGLLFDRERRLGYRRYLRPILKALKDYHPPNLRVRLDGEAPLHGALVVVSNVRSYGGLFEVTERARCDSGHLDVCILRRGRARDLTRYAWAAWRRHISSLSDADLRSAREIRIDAAEPVAVQVDGDYWGTTPVAISVEPAVVPIVVPREPAG